MFQGSTANYNKFRAKVKIWLPQLETLDGTNFDKDSQEIAKQRTEVEASKSAIIQRFTAGGSQLASIPEERQMANTGDEDVFKQLQKQSASQ